MTNTDAPSKAPTWLLRVSSILWGIWGLVHILAGVMTLVQLGAGNHIEAIHAITDKVDVKLVQMEYPAAVIAILSQHAFNLAWFGLVTLACAPFVWRKRRWAIYLAALVGGLADMGYFIFIDLKDYAMPPGPQMTWICATAIVTSMIAVRLLGREDKAVSV